VGRSLGRRISYKEVISLVSLGVIGGAGVREKEMGAKSGYYHSSREVRRDQETAPGRRCESGL